MPEVYPCQYKLYISLGIENNVTVIKMYRTLRVLHESRVLPAEDEIMHKVCWKIMLYINRIFENVSTLFEIYSAFDSCFKSSNTGDIRKNF